MLSVVVCTFNEEKNLPRLLNSVKSVADEIVVVDTESTDNTVEIAKKSGCKLFRHKNTSIIEPVRNFAISKAKGDWILLLDADEELSGGLISRIKNLKLHPEADYYRLPRQNIIFGKWIKNTHWWPDYVVRLFRKGSIIWQDQIHSLPETNGVGMDLPADPDISIIHHQYETISQFLQKMDRYTDIQAQELISGGFAFGWPDLLKKPFSEFISQLFARRGLSDGLHGLALAGLQAFSEFIVYLKIWQYHHFAQRDLSLVSLKNEIIPLQKEFSWWQTEYQLKYVNYIQNLWLRLKRKLI